MNIRTALQEIENNIIKDHYEDTGVFIYYNDCPCGINAVKHDGDKLILSAMYDGLTLFSIGEIVESLEQCEDDVLLYVDIDDKLLPVVFVDTSMDDRLDFNTEE
jgi:hypothetical protein